MRKRIAAKPTRTPTAGERLAALSPRRRARLLDPAEAEFAACGFQAASLNRILASAKMSKGQAYYYVTDKADLYRAVIERAIERLTQKVSGRFPKPGSARDFWSAVRDLLARLTATLKEDERLASLARGIYQGPQTEAALAEPLAKIRKELEKLALTGQRVGAVRTDVPLSFLLSGVFGAAREMDRWFAGHWQQLSVEEALRMNDKAVELIQAMAAVPRPRTRRRKR